jgi:ferrochelatase
VGKNQARYRRGVVLAQLGTPEAATAGALRRYLREFLGDRRVVDLPRLLWWPLLHGLVLRTRPRRSARLYRRIWTEGGSPLRIHTEAQRQGLARRLGDGYRVEVGMRYGTSSIPEALDRLVEAGCEQVLVLPLFPQFCSGTTASVFDAVGAWARGRKDLPSLAFVRGFADHPAYVAALAASVREAGVEATPTAPLLMSFHGIPRRLADRGDPYPLECERTATALAAALHLPRGAWRIVYQSRFGKARWLDPYLDESLRAMPALGVKQVHVITPAFVSDCLETIDEIGREAKETFETAGGTAYARVPCLNDRPDFLDALAGIVREHAVGPARS